VTLKIARKFLSCHVSKLSAGFSGRDLGFSDPSRSRLAGDAGRGVTLIWGDVFFSPSFGFDRTCAKGFSAGVLSAFSFAAGWVVEVSEDGVVVDG
jgi:hypothetical protein